MSSDLAESPLGKTYEVCVPPPLDRHLSCVCRKSQNHLASSGEEEAKRLVSRLEKYELQTISRSILPKERVSKCLRRLLKGGSFVDIYKAPQGSAFYGGLQTCGSIWVCPVCAAKISQGRREELRKAIAAWKAMGGQVLHLVLTLPHYLHQPLADVLAGYTGARRLMLNRKMWRGFSKGLGLAGFVRALEVTYGVNGWHVHSHELLFVEGGEVDLEQLRLRIMGMWVQALVSVGWKSPNGHGVQLQGGDEAGDYAAKWGLEDELCMGHIKRGRDENLSPWDLLRQVKEGDLKAPGLFEEYAKAFKGKSQLRWTKDLRDLLGVSERMDEELASSQDVESVLLGSLHLDHWRVVLAADRRGELLEVARVSGWPGVVEFVRELACHARIKRKLRDVTFGGGVG